MSKDKDQSSDDDASDLIDDAEIGELDTELEHLADEVFDFSSIKKANQKLAVKKRLDAYLERKWFKEHGWEDDDELFSDDFFSDPDTSRHSRL
ncbi:MAG: hypothetical protein WBM41_20660 [Arenicellales bacterium]